MKKPTTSTIIITIAVIAIILATVYVVYSNHSASTCTTAVRFIPIVGEITNAQDMNLGTSSTPEADEDTILSELQSANNDGSVKAIVLLIDSNGGYPETAEEIADEIGRIHKPIYALIRGNGDSAAYFIASAANKIYAFQSSDVGSIGVTHSYVSDAEQNTNNGLTFISLSSGPFKDTGNSDKPVTQADKDYLMKSVMSQYNIFVSTVAKNRNMTTDQVEALADGSSFLGAEALDDGLIDSDGGWDALWQEIDTHFNKPCYFVE